MTIITIIIKIGGKSAQITTTNFATTVRNHTILQEFSTKSCQNKGRLYIPNITKNIEIYDCKVHADGYVDTVICELRMNQGKLINYKYK